MNRTITRTALNRSAATAGHADVMLGAGSDWPHRHDVATAIAEARRLRAEYMRDSVIAFWNGLRGLAPRRGGLAPRHG